MNIGVLFGKRCSWFVATGTIHIFGMCIDWDPRGSTTTRLTIDGFVAVC